MGFLASGKHFIQVVERILKQQEENPDEKMIDWTERDLNLYRSIFIFISVIRVFSIFIALIRRRAGIYILVLV